MRIKILLLVFVLLISSSNIAFSGFFDDALKRITAGSKKDNSEETVISGLKEALTIGTENAVKNVSRPDGYFSNEKIRILMPEKIRTVADILAKIGFQKEMDDFILSMNRAAEKAAPKAAAYFVESIKHMSFGEAKKILSGGETAATDYFREKTSTELYDVFRPIISSSMVEVGVTNRYKQMMNKYETIPFVKKESLDLDHYVTTSSLNGMFYMVGREEKKIRTDPAARITELLKTVFGK